MKKDDPITYSLNKENSNFKREDYFNGLVDYEDEDEEDEDLEAAYKDSIYETDLIDSIGENV